MSEVLDLAVFAAVAKTARKSATLLEDMGIVEARAAVTIKDRNKVKLPDEQSLVLVFARRNLSLEAVSKGCTHLVVPNESVGAVTDKLAGMVFDGVFDKEIIAVQTLVKETKAKKVAKPVLIELEPIVVNDAVMAELDGCDMHAVSHHVKVDSNEVTEEEKTLLNEVPNIDGLDLSSID